MHSSIENLIEESQKLAETHAIHCTALITSSQLHDAIEYCRSLGIDPPQCSLTAQSRNAVRLREKAKEMLSDAAWWKKRLKITALRGFEQTQINAGLVSHGISDQSYDHLKANK